MSNKLKKYEICVDIASTNGDQTFACYARSELEARMALKDGQCEIIDQNVEVDGLGEIVDIIESSDISSRLSSDLLSSANDEIAALTEDNRLLNEECEQLKAERDELHSQLKRVMKSAHDWCDENYLDDLEASVATAKDLLNKHKGE